MRVPGFVVCCLSINVALFVVCCLTLCVVRC